MPDASTSALALLPDYVHNRALAQLTHPAGWLSPRPTGQYNLVIVGAGTAGLVAAAGAAGLGARVALIERHQTGGDCLNTGCVPSKAVIRAAHAAHEVARAASFGVNAGTITVDFGVVMERMRRLRTQIAPNDSFERFKGLGGARGGHVPGRREVGLAFARRGQRVTVLRRAIGAAGHRPLH